MDWEATTCRESGLGGNGIAGASRNARTSVRPSLGDRAPVFIGGAELFATLESTILQIVNAGAFVWCLLAIVAGWLPQLALVTNLQPVLVAFYLHRMVRPGADLRAWCDLAPDATLVALLPLATPGALLFGTF